jgi:hypothetical protein
MGRARLQNRRRQRLAVETAAGAMGRERGAASMGAGQKEAVRKHAAIKTRQRVLTCRQSARTKVSHRVPTGMPAYRQERVRSSAGPQQRVAHSHAAGAALRLGMHVGEATGTGARRGERASPLICPPHQLCSRRLTRIRSLPLRDHRTLPRTLHTPATTPRPWQGHPKRPKRPGRYHRGAPAKACVPRTFLPSANGSRGMPIATRQGFVLPRVAGHASPKAPPPTADPGVAASGWCRQRGENLRTALRFATQPM